MRLYHRLHITSGMNSLKKKRLKHSKAKKKDKTERNDAMYFTFSFHYPGWLSCTKLGRYEEHNSGAQYLS